MYIIRIYLRAHTVGLRDRIIGLKSSSQMENICEEKPPRVPDWDIQQQISGRTKKGLNDHFPS